MSSSVSSFGKHRTAELAGAIVFAVGIAAVFWCRGSGGKSDFALLLSRRRRLVSLASSGDASALEELKLVEELIEAVPASRRAPPRHAPGVPLLGGFIDFAGDPLGMVRRARSQLGDVFTVGMFNQNLTFLVGSEAHRAFFEASDDQLDQAPVYKFMVPVFGRGVIYDADLPKRRQQMRLVGSSLNPALLKKYPPIIAGEASAYFDTWDEGGQEFDVLHAMSELTILTASAALHGREVRENLCKEVERHFKTMDQGITPLSILFPYLPTPAHRRRDQAHKEMISLFSGVMTGRRESSAKGSVMNADVLQKLMDSSYKDGSSLPDHEIAGLLIALLFAGQHTSSITVTWTILFLLDDKRRGGCWLDKVETELRELEPSPGAFARGEVAYDQVSKMSILHSCIKEAIRMHPPLIMLMRRVVKAPLRVNGYLVPEGHNVMVSNAVAQRLEEVFENPDVYDPGRWVDFDIRKLPPYSFIGFGAGIHTCMGESFAFMQLRSVLAVLLSGYALEMHGPLPQADYEAMVVGPKGQNLITARRRTVAADASAPTPRRPAHATSVASVAAAPKLGSGSGVKISMAEVAKHDKADDCWLVYEGRVYDVTNYVPIHQGGDAILKWAGKDASALGTNLGPQHPSTVPELLERYCVGDLAS